MDATEAMRVVIILSVMLIGFTLTRCTLHLLKVQLSKFMEMQLTITLPTLVAAYASNRWSYAAAALSGWVD
ncbi:hypothetical protein JYG34_02575 [Pseudomonas entomophila]|uniref:hypothetical protein n=1 Tax=Pseudomonas entomophila TaxID=312306 RepID=UPI001BD0CB42|nr:hypothetical protein [Pseudomonas entomophila]QVM91938.1 hypothetical protein JYG34_02575 [Pseudomonas entomophila]